MSDLGDTEAFFRISSSFIKYTFASSIASRFFHFLAMSLEQPRYMSPCEQRLARMWLDEDEEAVSEIARRLRRSESTLWRFFGDPEAPRGVGRKPALTEADKDRLLALTERMVEEADCCYQVTYEMIQQRFHVDVGLRVMSNSLHERGVWFCRMREKPVLTNEDVAARWEWAKQHRGRTAQWWCARIQLHIDNHAFKVPVNAVARKALAARRVRGVLRTKKKGLKRAHVRRGRGLRTNTGARNVLVAAGVGQGKMLLWSVIESTWCGDSAAKLYNGALRTALKTAYPTRKRFNVLEDNDPTGYQSGAAVAVKELQKIDTYPIPKRSPDLNVMDYFVWSEIEKRMRQQERDFPEDYRESREEFAKRLRRTAKSIPAKTINKAIGDLAWRVEKLYQAKGALFEEGGRRPTSARIAGV